MNRFSTPFYPFSRIDLQTPVSQTIFVSDFFLIATVDIL